ncbi:MAG: hypothetical protein MR842_02195 [Clostridiales bacterium]|nr:hypothetical protein [Clostridiales bacterium]MDO4351062.1 hypothetical protein [Eubacteriales bacterium]MDY4008462.1 hypothetical protein [Candidatus Limiplasma sp.]
MLSIAYLLAFLAGGAAIARLLLPRQEAVKRAYLGFSLGVLLMMWLPVLWAYAVRFSFTAHYLALGTLILLTGLAYALRDRRAALPFDRAQKRRLLALACLVVPLTALSAYLQYTHSIRLAADGGYHVGQSTYGDLSLHLAICTSIVNAPFPLHNSLMLGATMAYPYLSDSFASTLYMLGLPLNTAMALTGTLMMALVFTGYGLLCMQLCRRRGAAALAFFLLFLNGGMGFLYTLDATVEGYSVTSMWDNLRNVMNGYYQTPTNQPDPHNLRWVNIICDMLIPQRGILGGWAMLMPALNLLMPPLCRRERHGVRELALLGLFAGGLPLIHTHSYLALVLFCAGACLYAVCTAPRGGRFQAFRPWLFYGAVAAALSLPQLIAFTFVQAADSDHFLSLWFNWSNNRGNRGLVDTYLWFYLKNVGVPYVLILLALCRRKPKGAPCVPDDVRQHRLIAAGAFLIYAVAELVKFQPNEYDNNKLLYVWFLLCLPMAADYAVEAFGRLRGLPGRRALAAMFLVCCFASSALTVARECVSDYQAYSANDLETAAYVRESTPEHCVFVTGNQHLNPVSSLAGRTILCSSDSYLYYHGFNTAARRAEIAAFYEEPAQNLDLLRRYQVQYVYVSPWERASSQYALNEAALEALFPLAFETADGQNRIFEVPKEYLQ